MLLKYGKKGEKVAHLQKLLNDHGASLAIDGDFGAKTERSVLAFQKSHNLVADGIVGDKTWSMLHGRSSPVRQLLSSADYEAAAARLGVTIPVIQAFAAVESAGAGFDTHGKPKILFERHKMYAHLKAKYGQVVADKHKTLRPNIVNTATGGYKGGVAEHVRLNIAVTIDADCANMSASWGQFQIMGENWQSLGYASISEFVMKMHESEAAQLDAFVRFIEHKKGLLAALQKGEWSKVFLYYNGRNYKKLGYDVKFTRELRRLEMLHNEKT
ncbi:MULTISPECIES: N-acetylmuramidase domain-containing protein [Moraxella]|uniref:Putative phage-encoded peptidoglycan binding protein n=1 Tax=Moraxella catarrhalis TaxID=480 RepID=A0A7Z0UXX9_MORCA|nr:N-acetylmuramidase family protein [Moraxella catarrhalis]OAV00216.1 putative phage-encoded peptidoglycan binding protein [Moraxella catarrhalis]STY82484.1 Zinc D-Ala-D-Ala carboxypeptidase precursor [Moraxella catarrhalis]